MDHSPLADLTPDQIRDLLEARGLRVLGDEDLAAVTRLAAGLREQARGLLPAVGGGGLADDDAGGETA
jgi:hypothetical protein